MNSRNIDKFVSDALAIEAEDARDAGALGFMARSLTLATMPHKKVEGCEFLRSAGGFTLCMLAPSSVGLPYGSIPRLLTAWMTTEAVKTKQRELVLGPSLSSFMADLDLMPTGGRWGSITRLRDQMRRLFSCSVHGSWERTTKRGAKAETMVNFTVVSKAQLWWDPKSPEQSTLWQSTITLGEQFFDEITERPIPVNMDALKQLKRSPMALDIYTWLTYRMFYLRDKKAIPWGALQLQLGSDYPMTAQGQRDFKKKFIGQFKKVKTVYREVKAEPTQEALILRPSRPHILPAPR